MKYFQWICFIFLSLISLFFTYNLAIGLGILLIEKIVMTSGSVGIEILKLYCLISANYKIETKKALKYYFTYGFVTLFSLFSSFGYAISTIDRLETTHSIVSKSDEIELQKKNLDSMDDAIKNLKEAIIEKQKLSYKEDNLVKKLKIQKSIKEDQETIENYISKKIKIQETITELQKNEQANNSVIKKTMYEVIGTTLNMSSKSIAFFILAIFAISLELGIFISSPHPVIKTTNNNNKNKSKTKNKPVEIPIKYPSNKKR